MSLAQRYDGATLRMAMCDILGDRVARAEIANHVRDCVLSVVGHFGDVSANVH